jgi:hypothetical protein
VGIEGRVLISSFDHRILASMAGSWRESRLAFGLLSETPLDQLSRYATEIVGCSTVHLSAESLGAASVGYRRSPGVGALRASEVRALTGRRVPVLVYTVNDHGPSGLANHLWQMGVAGFFTDDPRGLAGSIATWDGLGP